MPKADRILANLPPTYAVRGDPSALRAFTDAHGGELQSAENSLIAVMRAHWVTFADAGEPAITDLALFAALYGLAPRPDESVAEFREHLLAFVRTHLEGTVTVQGILRITAEALGLHIEDASLDAWWDRAQGDRAPGEVDVLTTSAPRGADAASAVLGIGAARVAGRDAAPGRLVGSVDLGAGIDLTGAHTLWVALDDGGAIPADLTTGVADPASASAAELAAALDAELGTAVATVEAGHLVLTSPTTGPGSAVAVEDGPDDAAELVLGLAPRRYTGAGSRRATITGRADLSAPVDLRVARYLRIVLDADHVAEVDCAAGAADPAAVDVAEITTAINAGAGVPVATDDGRFLTLTSPTVGEAGSVALTEPAAQPATTALFGSAPRLAVGTDATPARVIAGRAIGSGVDLRGHSQLRLGLDAAPAVTLDVAGLDPAATTPNELVTAINEGLGTECASHDGARLSLASSSEGPTAVLRIEEVDGDAALDVLGLRPRSGRGTAPVTANLTGTADLSGGMDLSSRNLIRLAVDGGEPVEIDLRAGVADVTAADVGELADAVNAALGAEDDPVAGDDGAHLILTSPTAGAAGSLEVDPIVTTVRRRFVTRARVLDEAATTVLGFTARTARGLPGTSARLTTSTDLSGGIDLTGGSFLRVVVGDSGAVEVDCAGPRPRATTAAEIAQHLADGVPGLEVSTDGRAVVLLDPTPGAASRVALEPPYPLDAADQVLGAGAIGSVTGTGAAGVHFTGTVDLEAGVPLPADAALRLGVDGAAPVDVPLGDGITPATLGLARICAQINVALGAPVAAHDGAHVLLTSPTVGGDSALVIEAPAAGTDATPAVLGIPAPRTYTGLAATAARVVGTVDLTGGADLGARHLLRLRVDGGAPVDVDLTSAPGASGGPVDLAAITAAIRAATTADAASVPMPGGLALALTSPTTGPASRLEVSRAEVGDAAPLLFGAAGRAVTGTDPTPATIEGEVDLLAPVDLTERSVLRLRLDHGEPVDADLAGVTPSATLGAEIVAAIEAVAPGVAALGATDRLVLTSPTTGPDGAVEVVPTRHLEVVEYPPTTDTVTAALAHGGVLVFSSSGSADVPGRVRVDSSGGVHGPRLTDPAAGWSVHVDTTVPAGGELILEWAPGGVGARVRGPSGWHPVDPALIHVSAGGGPGPLTVRRGRNRWSWTECDAARFDEAVFDEDSFAGGPCVEDAVFDVSRFSPAAVPARFTATADRAASAHVTVTWDSHTAGAFEVNLPADLDPRFGRPFGEARFGAAEPELIAGVVTEPLGDDDNVITRVNAESALIECSPAPTVPIGWRAVALPFREPVHLSLGSGTQPARMYVSGPGLAPGFLEVRAADPGTYGNDISVSMRVVGPEIYDVTVHLPGARFENARAVVAGPEPPTLAERLLDPTPIGVGTAKAAGIRAVVTRDRARFGSSAAPAGPDRPAEEG
ncbi:hypothetical protein [Occultella gossypii]|uniref:Phage tail protein (Tail_P2_I) n=1 Tax=Occultella gossypii TaxID=2800820 RepID=A0ABS7SH08_9MICO|nr:hypothetical protein [Occultella gossypii]MBZ2199652.1 hypothetical protein [Occultella gossypii]